MVGGIESTPRRGRDGVVQAAELVALRDLKLVGDHLASGLDPLLRALARTPIGDLQLRDMELVELPASIGGLTGLRHLDLDGVRIRELPDEIAACTELRWIVLPYTVRAAAARAKLPRGRWKKSERMRVMRYERTDLADG
jgi:hypothetical protein